MVSKPNPVVGYYRIWGEWQTHDAVTDVCHLASVASAAMSDRPEVTNGVHATSEEIISWPYLVTESDNHWILSEADVMYTKPLKIKPAALILVSGGSRSWNFSNLYTD